MRIIKRSSIFIALLLGFFTFLAQPAAAQERLCDTSFEDCRQPLWTLIDNESVGIDVSFWFIQDTSLSDKLVARFRAGVPVRVLCDPRANPTYSGNQQILNQLAAAGIPMRYKNGGGILHMKFMLFVGQNRLEFSGANYGPFFFVPNVPYKDYIDEAIYFTDDPAVVNSFKTQMDNLWTDTVNYSNYANINGPLTRKYATYPIDPALNFPPSADGSQDFYNRTYQSFNRETQKIDIIMYRITNDRYTNATVDAVHRGIPVRLITEQNEYRNPARQWDAYNVDLLYNAGVQIKIRAHQGLNHEKIAMLYGQGLTIFGSSNWTGPSSNSQQENNYFTTKTWFFNWAVNHFERKWNSTTETQPFIPLPPDPPVYSSPANDATGQPTNMTLVWEGGPWAHKYDIYLGTDPNPPLIASDQYIGRVDDGVIERYTLPPLQPGTKYYWRLVSRTMANVTANGATWSFTTAGTPPNPGPAPAVSGVSPNSGSTNGGASVTITGSNFTSGATVSFGGTAATGVNVASGTTITAVTPAHAAGAVDVVVRNADGQSATLTAGFTYNAPPPPTPGQGDIVLYASEAQVKAGNWTVVADPTAAGGFRIFNADAGVAKLNAPLATPTSYFEMTFSAQAGTAYRLWIRGKAQNDDWANDSVFIQFSDSVNGSGAAIDRIGTTSAEAYNLEDCSGCGLSGWGWQDNGWGVGVMGPLIYFQSTGTHTLRVQAREDGLSIDQIVLSASTYLNTSPGALKNDSTILPKTGTPPPAPAPGVSGVSPNSGSTNGGTSVTITGTNFTSGATVSFGGTAATGVNVASGTTITAVTPAHAAGAVDVVVRNADGQSATLTAGFTYVTPPASAPSVSAVSPNSGPDTGNTVVTITGTGFQAGATVKFGGVSAANVNVTSSTSITATTPAHPVGAVDVAVTNSDGQSGTLSSGFTYALANTNETVLLADDFNNNSLDTSKWVANNLFSGFTDTALPVVEINQRLEMGPTLRNASGSHYNGIRSMDIYNFSGAYCYVELVQAPASTTAADAMFTMGKDVSNYYRIFVEAGKLVVAKTIGGTKTTLLKVSYDAVNHRYWRIRHDAATGAVVFETAADSGGSPGTWVQQYSEIWNAKAVPLTSVQFELKAGTWQAEANAGGNVIFDNFKAAKP